MATRKKHLINVHTSTGTTAPTGASLYLGEIAVQHTPDEPGLWIKMGTSESSDEYEKFIGETKITSMLSEARILGSAYTYTGLPQVNSATTLEAAYSALTKEVVDGSLVFHVIGSGHGVGMSQYGANVMAQEGAEYREILAHYYPGTKLE